MLKIFRMFTGRPSRIRSIPLPYAGSKHPDVYTRESISMGNTAGIYPHTWTFIIQEMLVSGTYGFYRIGLQILSLVKRTDIFSFAATRAMDTITQESLDGIMTTAHITTTAAASDTTHHCSTRITHG